MAFSYAIFTPSISNSKLISTLLQTKVFTELYYDNNLHTIINFDFFKGKIGYFSNLFMLFFS